MYEQEINIYWKTVVNTIQDGVLIVNTEGTIVSANKALEEITGYLKEVLIEALESAGGNQSRAAEILGISRVTVWNRMKRYGITAQKKIDR